MKTVSLEGGFATGAASPRLLGRSPADGSPAREGFVSGELEKRCDPKHLLCLKLSGGHHASAISDCFWAKYWRFSVPRARDFFAWCWEQVQVSALPWQICSIPKGEHDIKIRGLQELEN